MPEKKKRLTPAQLGMERKFYAQLHANTAASQRELATAKYDAKLRRMMNCRKVDKLDEGDHAFTPAPKIKRYRYLDLDAATMYLRTGAILVSDCVTKERVITTGTKQPLGYIHNDIMLKLFGRFAFDSAKIPGTNKTRYWIIA